MVVHVRPRLPLDVEEALEPTERRSAKCYHEIENCTVRFSRLARQISEDCVPEEVPEEDSLVVHVQEAVKKIRP